MKILQVCNKLPFPANDGSSIAITSLTEGFIKHNAEVHMLSMVNNSNNKLSNLPAWAIESLKLKTVNCNTRSNPFKAAYNLFFSKKPYEIERFYSESFNKVLIDLLKHERFDIIQLEGLALASYIDDIKHHSDALIAMRAHNVEHEIRSRGLNYQVNIFIYTYLKLMVSRLRKFETEMLSKFDLLVPITYRDLLKFNEMGNIHPSIAIPFAMNPERAKVNDNYVEFPSIFFLGALDWTPNQGGLIWFINNVWDRLSEKYPNLKFYIAGRNSPSWLRKYFLAKNIVFLGEVPNAYDFMATKAIMVVPLFYGSGMRVKIIEAMAMGKAIISTELGAEGINISNGKNLLIANDPDAFINQIDNMINNPQLYRNVCQSATEFIKENFNNTTIAKHLVDFYNVQLSTR